MQCWDRFFSDRELGGGCGMGIMGKHGNYVYGGTTALQLGTQQNLLGLVYLVLRMDQAGF